MATGYAVKMLVEIRFGCDPEFPDLEDQRTWKLET